MNADAQRPSLEPEAPPASPRLEPAAPPAVPAIDSAPPINERIAQAMPALSLDRPGGGGSRWEQGRRVTALWSVDQERNAWVGIAGVGWRRLDGASDSALVALTMLAAHAREQGAGVSYREQDGVIQELYVW